MVSTETGLLSRCPLRREAKEPDSAPDPRVLNPTYLRVRHANAPQQILEARIRT